MTLPLPLLILVLITSLSACTRGKTKDEKAVAASTTAAPVAAPANDTDWLEGKLPASVTEGTPVDGGEVTLHLDIEPPSLNSTVDSDWWASRITEHHIYESLVGVDPHDDPGYRHVPELAERWDISDDKLVYTFHLRHNVLWHDGKPFTSKDVLATFDKIQDQTTKAAHIRSYFEELIRYEAVDDFTVRFYWKRPYFMTLDAFNDVVIQPAHVIAKLTGTQYNEAATNPLNRHPIGTGPFRFEMWEANQRIVIVRNDQYWGTKAHLARITFRIVKDPTVAQQLAERGELETLERPLADQWVEMRNNDVLKKRFHRSAFYEANYQYVAWNQAGPLFKDKRVRMALTLLIDRPGIINRMLHGLRKPTECVFYWKSEQCDPAITPPPYDPQAGMALLDQAGWKDTNNDGVRDKDGVPFKFVFMIPATTPDAERMATKMKEDFKRAGIEMDVQKVEWSAFTKRLREHEFDACTLLWGFASRQDPTQVWHSNSINGGSNYIGFRNAEADKLIETARATFDENERRDMFRRFNAIIHDEQPYTLMFVRPRLALVSKRLKGVRESLSFWQWEDWWIDPAATR